MQAFSGNAICYSEKSNKTNCKPGLMYLIQIPGRLRNIPSFPCIVLVLSTISQKTHLAETTPNSHLLSNQKSNKHSLSLCLLGTGKPFPAIHNHKMFKTHIHSHRRLRHTTKICSLLFTTQGLIQIYWGKSLSHP